MAGGIGSALRYLVVTWTERAFGTSFPFGVFGVNIVGSFLIAVVMMLAISRADMITPTVRLTLTAGFMGGLTTYSSFNQDTLSMLDKKQYGAALFYVSATLIACILAGWLGVSVARPR